MACCGQTSGTLKTSRRIRCQSNFVLRPYLDVGYPISFTADRDMGVLIIAYKNTLSTETDFVNLGVSLHLKKGDNVTFFVKGKSNRTAPTGMTLKMEITVNGTLLGTKDITNTVMKENPKGDGSYVVRYGDACVYTTDC